ncbi:hypothetical protein RB195_011875 [Necator americanus]|uniref:G-protein coupled receptors family 1 profile domain-containing protein n=1 Tax=Necator americanus TaxID=51031 RepID=A0ABR1D4E5_NECAM
MFGTTLLLNLLVIAAIVSARKRCKSAFFKLVGMLSVLFLFHCISMLVLKFLPIFFSYSFIYQNEISLHIDIFVKYCSILLIFILSLDRFSVFKIERLERFISSRFGPWILALLASLIAVSTTVVVVKVGSMKRSYINGLGYFDYSPSSVALTVANYCSIVISLLSIGLHVFIYLWMKKIRSTFVHSKTHTTGRAERLMSLQVVLIATFELVVLYKFAEYCHTDFNAFLLEAAAVHQVLNPYLLKLA